MFSVAAPPNHVAAAGTSEGPASAEEPAMAAAVNTAEAEHTGWHRRAMAILAFPTRFKSPFQVAT